MKRFNGTALFFIILGFFVLTMPANHSEAEDAYHYARMTEQGAPAELFHAHHLLYLPLMRGIYRAAQFTGYSGRALPVLIGVSMVSGAWAVCLFAAVLRWAGVSRGASALFAAVLLFSYGFWRYSTTAEIYLPVAAVSLFTLYCALRSPERPVFFLSGAAAGGLALLLHLVAIPVVLMAVPLFYLLKGDKKRAAGHAVIALLLAGGGYLAVAAAGIQPGIYQDALAPRGTLIEPLTWLKGAAAFGQTVLSGNFLFSIPSAAERLLRMFPFHMLQEELFAGQQAAPWIRRAAPVTFGLAAGLAGGMICVLIRSVLCLPWRALRRLASPETAAVFVWLAGLAGMALLFEPANPEMWISVGPPFWLLAALVWTAVGPKTGKTRFFPALLAVALLLHNGIGGIAVVKSAESDYCRQKGLWLMENARPGDLILTADSHSSVTFLEYYTPAKVLDLKFVSPEQFQAAEKTASGRVFVFDEVIDPLPPVRLRPTESINKIEQLGAMLRPGLTPVYENGRIRIYEWHRNRNLQDGRTSLLLKGSPFCRAGTGNALPAAAERASSVSSSLRL